MSDIYLLDHNPIDSRLTFTYKRRLHMANRQGEHLRLTEYVPMANRWIPVPIYGDAGRGLHEHLIEYDIQM